MLPWRRRINDLNENEKAVNQRKSFYTKIAAMGGNKKALTRQKGTRT
jgi:hypothetical protein